MADEIKTTRLELIETRKSIRLAENGHNGRCLSRARHRPSL